MNLGKAIRIAIINKGIKQRELAEKMGVSAVFISRMCNQPNVGINTLIKVASALDMKVSELVKFGE